MGHLYISRCVCSVCPLGIFLKSGGIKKIQDGVKFHAYSMSGDEQLIN